MDKRIADIMKKYGIKSFNFYAEDLFTYVLETDTHVEGVVLHEVKQTLCKDASIKNVVMGILPGVKFEVQAGKYTELPTSMVSHPAHYNIGRIEVIEAMEDWKLDLHIGNAVKYLARAGRKNPDKEIEDLEKAVWYIRRKVELLKSKKENRTAVRPNDMVKQ